MSICIFSFEMRITSPSCLPSVVVSATILTMVWRHNSWKLMFSYYTREGKNTAQRELTGLLQICSYCNDGGFLIECISIWYFCWNHVCLRKVSRLFNPGDFDASKLTVKFEDNANTSVLKSVEDLLPRKYTLTHSDVTGELLLSIGPSFNRLQVSAIRNWDFPFKTIDIVLMKMLWNIL